MSKSLGVELFTLSKDQFKLYFDTLYRMRKEVKIDLHPDKKHVFCRTMDNAKISLAELTLRIEPKEFTTFEIPLESIMKLSPKKDVTFYDDGHVVVLSNGDFVLRVAKLDPRVSNLGNVKTMPSLTWVAKIHLDKPTIEKWYEYFKVANEWVIFEIKDKKLTIKSIVENENQFELPEPIPVDGEDCICKIPQQPIIDTFAHYKVYDTAIIHLGTDIPIKIDLGSDLLSIMIGIAPRIDNDDDD